MYEYAMFDPLEENSFRLIKLKEGVARGKPPYEESDMECSMYVRHQLVDTAKSTKRLEIQCSSDNVNWTDFTLDYEGFKQKVSEEIKKMIADGKSKCTIPLSWLEGLKILALVQQNRSSGWSMYAMSIGLIEQENWKSKMWDIFHDLDDSFWNSDCVRFNYHLQDNGEAISLFAFYNHDKEKDDHEQQEAESMSNYYAFLLSVLRTLLSLFSTEETELPLKTCIYVHWKHESDEHMVMRVLHRQLANYGAFLIRKHHDFYVSQSRPLQEQEIKALEIRCSDIMATLRILHPTLFLVEARHKKNDNMAMVGCYREECTAKYVVKYLKRKFPGDSIEYEVLPVTSTLMSTKLLQELDYTHETIISDLS